LSRQDIYDLAEEVGKLATLAFPITAILEDIPQYISDREFLYRRYLRDPVDQRKVNRSIALLRAKVRADVFAGSIGWLGRAALKIAKGIQKVGFFADVASLATAKLPEDGLAPLINILVDRAPGLWGRAFKIGYGFGGFVNTGVGYGTKYFTGKFTTASDFFGDLALKIWGPTRWVR
jgi:hypothetical protein